MKLTIGGNDRTHFSSSLTMRPNKLEPLQTSLA
jgi:hypothetical protein